MDRGLRIRFGALMFLQYMASGSIFPILSHYLKNYLHFEAFHVGLAMAMPPLAALIALPLAAYLADRYIRVETMLSFCYFAAAAVMFILSRQDTLEPFLGLYLIFGLVFTPTFGLTNALVLHHLTDAKRNFGGIRMWGTAGWITVAWGFGYFWLQGGSGEEARLPHALLLHSILATVVGIYVMTLPRSEGGLDQATRVPLALVLRVFTQPSVVVLCVVTLFNSMAHQFYYYGMSIFLSQTGFADEYILPAMSVGQISEVTCMALLGFFIMRLGLKNVILLGIAGQVARALVFATTTNTALILFGIAIHGICYAFFFTAAYIYIDQHSTRRTRAGAQQLYTIMIMGLGHLMGFLLAGSAGRFFTQEDGTSIDYTRLWLVPVVLSVVTFAGMAIFFREEPAVEDDAR